MSPRRRRTPQERKELSLARDTVDAGEYPKAFRRQHPLRRARAERAARREVRRRLMNANGNGSGIGIRNGSGSGGGGGDRDVDAVRRREVRKWPPVRLGDLIRGKAARRLRLQENPRKSPEARERRRRRRG